MVYNGDAYPRLAVLHSRIGSSLTFQLGPGILGNIKEIMKSTIYAAAAALAFSATQVASHSTFQDLWVEGVDKGATCVRLPLSNSPVTDVTSDDIACNVGTSPVSGKCAVSAGSTVTVEMHQQPGDRSCANEAIGGDHFGPLQVYMAKVDDASTAVGADASWFKVFADTWASNSASSVGSGDYWGVKDLNSCCGLMDVQIPSDIAPGDYLLRAEVIALHVAGGTNGAQFYMSCYQLTVTGSGSASPSGVSLPGAYSASDPGILINIYQSLSTYEAPGPTVYSGGSTKSAGSPCEACEATCVVGSSATSTATATKATTTATTTTSAGTTVTTKTSTTSSATSTSTSGCTAVAAYGQCGGSGYTGCTTCASGSTCSHLNDYYYQCVPS
ncbi:carbohydrate-binding module family 1 protein [Xylariaceae sp. FL1272]|nr:carbohydrate-binding module family 1 protein [Xylariaceae sp. FL1272]